MNRRGFILAGSAAGFTVGRAALAAPEFEISYHPELSAAPGHGHPWQTRAVRWIDGREFEWYALTDEYPTDRDLAWFRQMVEAAFQRTKPALA